jgi:uncharacterized protein (DUF2336 family)
VPDGRVFELSGVGLHSMGSLPKLIKELEASIAHGSSGRRGETLRRVTDLFLLDPEALSEQQVDVFDLVITRLAHAIEMRARAELSERLAGIPNAPRGVVRSLAHDQIVVARPVLTRSERLSDDDLIAVALAKGRDHMLAISERARLSEPVTDVLVSRGDRVVAHAVAGNPGARLSRMSSAALINRACADEALQALLSQRDDLAEAHIRQLVAVARETARRRLAQTLPGVKSSIDAAVEQSAQTVEAAVSSRRDYSHALAVIHALTDERGFQESDLLGFAANRKFEETVCGTAYRVGLSIAATERLFEGAEADLLLVIGKSQGWSWRTVRALLGLRTPPLSAKSLGRAQETYDGLSPTTSQRVVHFLKAREATERRSAEQTAARRHIRRKSEAIK